MVIITTLTSIGIAALISLLGWTLRRLVTDIDARFSVIDSRFDRIDGRLDRFEDSLKELRGDMNSQNKDLRADMETQNKEVRADIASLREDHARLEGKLDGMLISTTDKLPASEKDKMPAAKTD